MTTSAKEMTKTEAQEFWGKFHSLKVITEENVGEWEVLMSGLVGQKLTYGCPALGEKIRAVTIKAFDPVERIVILNDEEIGITKMSMVEVLRAIGTYYWSFIIKEAA